MSLKNDLSELDGIKEEIKKLSLTLKTLKDKKNSIEQNIIEYLKNKDIKGLKFNNNIISLEKKEHRVRKKKNRKTKGNINSPPIKRHPHLRQNITRIK